MTRPHRTIPAGLLAALAAVGPARAADPAAEAFERDVRPLLVAECQRCHGPKKQEGGLRLDAREFVLKGGESGPAVVPGKPDESRLVKAVRREGDLAMPPDKTLTPAQVAALTAWVKGDPTMQAWGRIIDKGYATGYAFGRKNSTGLAGYEVLQGNGAIGFQTPLANLHPFQGWAEVFLTKPPNGLKDAYFKGGYGFAA